MSNQYVMEQAWHKGRIRTNPWLFSIETGFYAGLFFGVLRWISYQMKFTTVLPGFLLDNFVTHAFLKTGWGIVAGIAAFIGFSIVCALIYMVALRKMRGPWPGIFYGIAWWVVLFGFVLPLLGITKWLYVIGWNTIFTEISIFTIRGLFIGFTITFEFTDEASREPMTLKGLGNRWS